MKLSKPDKEEVPSTSLSSLPIKLQRLISSLISKRNTITLISEEKLLQHRISPDTIKQCTEERDLNDYTSELESNKKLYTAELIRIYQDNGLSVLSGPGWNSQIKTRVTRSLSESKLIDHGVSIKVIQACIEEKESEPYLEIRKVKEKK